jgi:hypothetical protein
MSEGAFGQVWLRVDWRDMTAVWISSLQFRWIQSILIVRCVPSLMMARAGFGLGLRMGSIVFRRVLLQQSMSPV